MELKTEDARIVLHAQDLCFLCGGRGRRYTGKVCACVFRSVFRTALAKYRNCQTRLDNGGCRPLLRLRHGAGWSWSFRDAEYCADFERVGSRIKAVHAQIFLWHVLGGQRGGFCARRLGLASGDFWHAVYLMQEAIGEQMLAYLYPLRGVAACDDMPLPLPIPFRPKYLEFYSLPS